MRHLMKTSVLILIAFAAILAMSSTTEAINPNEFERAYFISQYNTEWLGSYHRLCDGERYIEGTIGEGGLMVLVTFPCDGAPPAYTCSFRLCDDPDDETTCSGVFRATQCPRWVEGLNP